MQEETSPGPESASVADSPRSKGDGQMAVSGVDDADLSGMMTELGGEDESYSAIEVLPGAFPACLGVFPACAGTPARHPSPLVSRVRPATSAPSAAAPWPQFPSIRDGL